MLGSLKKKFSSALQEGLIISESLQQQVRQRVSSSSTTPTTPTTPTTFDANTQSPRGSRTSLNTNELGIPADLNMAAGCNLLAKYEDDWQGISQTNEQNANKAAQIAKQIEQIDQRVTKQKVTLDDLLNCLQSLPQLVKKVEESKQTLQQLTALSATVEAELLELQDLCEECALQEFMLEKEFEYSQATQRKMVELERYRQQVALEHELKLQKHEEHLRKIQKERQAVFDDAFRGDLEEFKQKGTLSRIDKDVQQSLALEEVVLEDAGVTSDALEEFLNG